MFKAIQQCLLFGVMISLTARSQPVAQPAINTYTYYPPTQDKESWQRLNLWLSSTYLYVSKEAMADQDSCLIQASRSLGLSRFSILAEGFGDKDLAKKSHWIDQAAPANGVRLLAGSAGKDRLQQLLLLGAYYAFQPGSYLRYKDSSAHYLQPAIRESEALHENKLGRIARCLLAKVYLQGNDNKGDSLCTLLINLCAKAGDKETAARTIAWRGMYAVPGPATFQRKIDDLQEAARRYQELGDTEGAINMYTDLGYLLVAMADLEKAHTAFLKALTLGESIQFPYTHYNSETVAMVTFFQGKFGEPLRYLRQTIRMAEKCRDSLGWSFFYARMSELLIAEGRPAESVAMAEKAIHRFLIDRNPSVYLLLNNVVKHLGEQGRVQEALHLVAEVAARVGPPATVGDLFFYHLLLSNCKLYQHQLDSAELHIRKLDSLETIMEGVRGPFRRNSINEQLALIHFARGQYHKARAYTVMHFNTPSTSEQSLMNAVRTYRFLISIDSALGDKAAMVADYRQYARLLDSNFRVTRIRQAEELQVVYEMQEKENHIVALNLQAQQSIVVRNLTLGGIAAVLVIAALLYRQNRLRRKNNQLITHQNGQLQDLVSDKEWLLKEIHHRVKNNLEIIMSLLNSQSRYIDNDAALTAINDSQRRVHAISLIHQKLYQTDNNTTIDMQQYIDELISNLQDSFDTRTRTVIEQHIDPVPLDVAKAIPLGLIINEGIVNAVKYAFPDNRQGIVRISLQQHAPDQLELTISDNGVGLSASVNPSDNHSLGFSLMRGLARQLDGELQIDSSHGLQLSIRFNPQTITAYEQE